MKRFLGILAALSLVTVLASVVLAVTVLRPRTEVLRPTLTDWPHEGAPLRLHNQITHRWELYPPSQWHFAKYGGRSAGWQYGPFAFKEVHSRIWWPVAVEKAARAIAVRKLGVKEPELDIQCKYSPVWRSTYWHVVASTPGGKRLEMDFELTLDDHAKPLIRRQ